MKFYLIILMSLFTLSAYAGFGGSRSSFSGSRSFSSSRSFSAPSRSFGGTRSYGGGASVSRPAPRPSAPPARSAPSETHVHNYGGGGSGNGFFTGWLMGNVMSNHAPTVVVQGTQAAPSGASVDANLPALAPSYIAPEAEGHGTFYYFMMTIFWLGMIGILLYFVLKIAEVL